MIRIVYFLFALVACSASCDEHQDYRTDGGTVSLPSSRNTTYAVGSQVKSADLNDLQDCIVGSKHPSRWYWFNPMLSVWTAGTNDAVRTSGYLDQVATTSQQLVPLNGLFVGQRIISTGLRYKGNNTGFQGIWANFQYDNADGTGQGDIDYFEFTDADALYHTYTQAVAAPHTILAGKPYAAKLKLGNGVKIFAVGIEVDLL